MRQLASPTKAISQTEFIALMAMIVATVAFSLDAMLPSLPDVARELSDARPNAVQMVITAFVLGLGLGTFVTGPLSDTFGRKPVILWGAVIYCLAAVWGYYAGSLEALLAARVLQGLGAAGPRVVSLAMIRDSYDGRDMARILSFVMLVFSIVPALAPALGHYITVSFGWRSIYLAFIGFAVVSMAWMALRQPETLAPHNRRALSVAMLAAATQDVFAHPTTRLTILIQMLVFGMLFSVLASTQLVFDQTFGRGDTFHIWYGGIAIFAATAGLVNAYFVMRVGMRAVVRTGLSMQIGLSSLMVLAVFVGGRADWVFYCYVLWSAGTFYQAGLCIGNLNTLALEPLGHIAGLAASVVAALATIGAVVISTPIGLAFDGTPLPLAMGTLLCASLGLWLTLKIKRPGEA